LNILSVFNKRENLFIEVDKKYIKLLQSAIKGNSIIVSKLLVEPVSGLSEEEISSLLTDIIRSNNITFDFITAIISRERIITRSMKFPSIDSAEISNMVSFEIAKQTPYSQDDIVSDYKIMGIDDQGYSEVAIVFSPKSEIARISDILGSFANKLKHIYFTSDAIYSWVQILYPDLNEKEYLCVINIDSGTTEIAVFSKSGLCFSRSAPIGAEDILQPKGEPDPLRERLVKEIEQSITLYLKEKKPEPGIISKIILTGAGSVLKEFEDSLYQSLKIPIEHINPLSSITLSDNALSESGISENVSVASLCGSIFAEGAIDLLPEEQKIKSRKNSLIRKAVIIFIASVSILSVIIGAVFFKIYQKENMLKKLEAMYGQIEKVSVQTEEKLKKLRSIKSHLAEGESSLDVIYNLYTLVPAGIVLLDFDYDDISKTVRFSGRSGRMSDVFSLVSVIEASDIFSNVETRSVVQRRTKEGVAVDFQIRCNFKKE
jgi:Tfp pilus assembly PilM family ATPase